MCLSPQYAQEHWMCLHLAKYSNSSSIVQNTLKTAYLCPCQKLSSSLHLRHKGLHVRILNIHINTNAVLKCLHPNKIKTQLYFFLTGNYSARLQMLLPHLSNGVAHILVDCVGHLCSLHTTAKLHAQDSRVVPEPPVVSFVTRQPSAVDTRLLPCTNTDNLENTGEERLGNN